MRKSNNIIRGALICLIVLALALILILVVPVKASAYEGNRITTARQDRLHDAAEVLRSLGFSDDTDVIKALQKAWWDDQEALDILAKVVAHEADPEWCEWEHSVAVAVVVLNRVESPYFKGDTVKEIVAAPGQYLEWYTHDFQDTPRKCYEVAKAALDGNHDVPKNALWQDNTIQGCYIWKAFLLDTGWFRSTTYICCGVPGVD